MAQKGPMWLFTGKFATFPITETNENFNQAGPLIGIVDDDESNLNGLGFALVVLSALVLLTSVVKVMCM
jgi:hypothetical protein